MVKISTNSEQRQSMIRVVNMPYCSNAIKKDRKLFLTERGETLIRFGS